jgi:hypothetical protein
VTERWKRSTFIRILPPFDPARGRTSWFRPE